MPGVTPNFDFEADATPTRELLFRQARSLQIDLASLDLIDATFLKVRAGDESGATGADTSTVGEMWMSPGEQLLIDFGDGPVTAWTPDGWWESNRYPLNNDYGESKPGMGAYANAQVGGTTENGARWNINPTGFHTSAINASVNVITNESAFSGNCRVLGHGPCFAALVNGTKHNVSAALQPGALRIIGTAPSATFWYVVRSVPNHESNSSHNFRRFVGYGMGLSPESSAYSTTGTSPGSLGLEHSMYGHFSGAVIGPGAVN
jgi:hypothetical protein